jgi:hypothetical protein
MTGSYTNIFGGTAIKPALVALLELSMSTNTVLSWPTEVASSANYFASIIDVTATVGGLTLTLPNALLASTGQSSLIANVGAQNFTVRNNSGVQVAIIAPGQQWLVYLYDNTTQGGLWRAVQMAATTSQGQASALAGAGLLAVSSKLNVSIPTQTASANRSLLLADQANLIVWNGAIGTLTLDTTANLGADWWAAVANHGSGALTLMPTGETINGAASLILQPGASAVIVAAAGSFNTYANPQSPWSVLNGGTGASDPTNALVNLGGSTIGISIFEAPSASAVVALLGLSNTTLTESTVATNQVLNAASTQTAFVATAALQLTLPVTTSLSKTYLFTVYAQGGAVTIHPNAADAVNGGVAGANYVINQGASALFVTDANGNWWPFYVATAGTVTSVGLSAPAEFAVTGSPVSTSGTLALAWANEAANKILAGPTSGGAGTPGFRTMVNADLPVPLNTTYVTSGIAPSGGVLDISAIAANGIDLSQSSAANINALGGSAPVGARRLVRFTGSTPGQLSNSGSLVVPGAITLVIGQFDVAEFVCLGTGGFGVWELTSYLRYTGAPIYGSASAAETLAGTDAVKFLTAAGFAGNQSLATNGYYKFPGAGVASGVILQWGTLAMPSGGTVNGSFPIAFPNGCIKIVGSYQDSGNVAGGAITIVQISASQYQVFSPTATPSDVAWFAIGD